MTSKDVSYQWFTCTHRDARIIARSGRGRPQNDQGWSFKADSCLFSHVHVIADNIARDMSADQKVSIPDSNLDSNGFLSTKSTVPQLSAIFV